MFSGAQVRPTLSCPIFNVFRCFCRRRVATYQSLCCVKFHIELMCTIYLVLYIQPPSTRTNQECTQTVLVAYAMKKVQKQIILNLGLEFFVICSATSVVTISLVFQCFSNVQYNVPHKLSTERSLVLQVLLRTLDVILDSFIGIRANAPLMVMNMVMYLRT